MNYKYKDVDERTTDEMLATLGIEEPIMHECKKHGNIGSAVAQIFFRQDAAKIHVDNKYCWLCIMDLLNDNIGQVTQIGG